MLADVCVLRELLAFPSAQASVAIAAVSVQQLVGGALGGELRLGQRPDGGALVISLLPA